MDNKKEAAEKAVKSKQPYCTAEALRNHRCTFEGGDGKRVIYDFREGDEVVVLEEAHYKKLAHPYNRYITPVKGRVSPDGEIVKLQEAAKKVMPKEG